MRNKSIREGRYNLFYVNKLRYSNQKKFPYSFIREELLLYRNVNAFDGRRCSRFLLKHFWRSFLKNRRPLDNVVDLHFDVHLLKYLEYSF